MSDPPTTKFVYELFVNYCCPPPRFISGKLFNRLLLLGQLLCFLLLLGAQFKFSENNLLLVFVVVSSFFLGTRKSYFGVWHFRSRCWWFTMPCDQINKFLDENTRSNKTSSTGLKDTHTWEQQQIGGDLPLDENCTTTTTKTTTDKFAHEVLGDLLSNIGWRPQPVICSLTSWFCRSVGDQQIYNKLTTTKFLSLRWKRGT